MLNDFTYDDKSNKNNIKDMSVLWTIIGATLAKFIPTFIEEKWQQGAVHKWTKRPPKKLLSELRFYLETIFPQNPPSFEDKNCRYLSNSESFFKEKTDMLDSLERDTSGSINIICRVPWLIMPDAYRDMSLSSPGARAYYSMLERQAKSGKLKYLYNFNSLGQTEVLSALTKGIALHSYPMFLTSTNFDIMLVNTDRHRNKILFASRPIGIRDQEVGIILQQKDIYGTLQDYFQKLWDETSNFWQKQMGNDLASLTETLRLLQP